MGHFSNTTLFNLTFLLKPLWCCGQWTLCELFVEALGCVCVCEQTLSAMLHHALHSEGSGCCGMDSTCQMCGVASSSVVWRMYVWLSNRYSRTWRFLALMKAANHLWCLRGGVWEMMLGFGAGNVLPSSSSCESRIKRKHLFHHGKPSCAILWFSINARWRYRSIHTGSYSSSYASSSSFSSVVLGAAWQGTF